MNRILERNEAVEMEIKKFFENIENIKSCVDIFSVLVDESIAEN